MTKKQIKPFVGWGYYDEHGNTKIADLRRACLALAKLASDKPEFFNPLEVADAKRIRDYVLRNRELFQ